MQLGTRELLGCLWRSTSRLSYALVLGAALTVARAEGEASPPDDLPTIPLPPDEDGERASLPDTVTLEPIEVTGSRIRRTDFESAQPVTVIDATQIARSGLVNIGELLQELPAAGAAQSRQVDVYGRGTTEMDLRNLGSQRILVLINGHRWVRSADAGNTGAVDLNTIPLAIIERVEVLRDGASAIYGSEAISGVVNIITRKEYAGSDLQSQIGNFPRYGDGFTQAHHISFGTVMQQSPVFLNLSYVQQESVSAGDRAISRFPKYGTGMSRGFSTTPRGDVVFVPNSANGSILGEEKCPTFLGGSTALVVAGNDTQAPVPSGFQFCDITLIRGQTITGDPAETTSTVADRYKTFDHSSVDPALSDNYNLQPLVYLATPFEQGSMFGQASHQISEDIEVDVQLLYNIARTEMQLAETATFTFGDFVPGPLGAVYVDARQAFNPFDQDIGRFPGQGTDADSANFGVGSGAILRRFVEAGPRVLKREKATWLAKPSLGGRFDWLDQPVRWESGALLAHSAAEYSYTGDIRTDRLKLALGPPEDCNASPGCTPLNIFGAPGAITPEMLNYVLYQSNNTSEAELQDAYFNLSMPIGTFGFLPAPMSAAFGVEYRDETFIERLDPRAVTGMNGWGFDIAERTSGGYAVEEAFLELHSPLLAGAPFADELDVELAGRYTKYEIFRRHVTGKAGVRWKPQADLLVRGTASQAFRGPSVTDLYAGAKSTFGGGDPCASGLDPQREQGTVADQNCDSEGVPERIPAFTGWVMNFGGNRDLRPETGYSLTAGFVYSPDAFADLTLSMNWFKFHLDDFIDYLDPGYVFDTCYNEPWPDGRRPQTCDLVTRRSDGKIETVRAASYNFTYVTTDGVDLSLDYQIPLTDWFSTLSGAGAVKLMLESAYLNSFDRAVPAADGGSIKTGYAGLSRGDQVFPRFKASGRLTWSRAGWDTTWTTRFIGPTTERCNDYYQYYYNAPSLRDLGLCSAPDPDITDGDDSSRNRVRATYYHDVHIGSTLSGNGVRFALGVLNLFDQDPPVSYTTLANSYPSTGGYRVPGTQAYIRLQKHF